MNGNEEPLSFLHATVDSGEHWYRAVLKTMARWDQAEEIIGDRRYRYLIGGEAFDWLLLAERLVEELDGAVDATERETLLFHGRPPLEIDEEEFQALLGTPKYQAYLNFLYGVVVEEALQLAVEEEVAKEQQSHVWTTASLEAATVFHRIYGKSQVELLREFQQERGLAETENIELSDFREFTYWLFKYRVRNGEGARVASDTRKGLAALSRVEAAARKRFTTEEPVRPAPETATPRLRRAMREKMEHEQAFARVAVSARVIDLDSDA
jgi:hypothetical protein